MPSLHNQADRETLFRRIASLTPASERHWGRMTPAAMLHHLCESARMAAGELPVKPKNMWPFQVFPLKHLLLYVVPFPKGAPTAPELLAGESYEFDAERSRLLGLLSALGTGPSDGPGATHPLFGPLTKKEWGVLAHKHVDHHLRQFGA